MRERTLGRDGSPVGPTARHIDDCFRYLSGRGCIVLFHKALPETECTCLTHASEMGVISTQHHTMYPSYTILQYVNKRYE